MSVAETGGLINQILGEENGGPGHEVSDRVSSANQDLRRRSRLSAGNGMEPARRTLIIASRPSRAYEENGGPGLLGHRVRPDGVACA